MDGLPGNRRLNHGDIICGTFLICSHNDEGEDVSLSDEQLRRYTERFQEPEQYTDEEAHNFEYEIGIIPPAGNESDEMER